MDPRLAAALAALITATLALMLVWIARALARRRASMKAVTRARRARAGETAAEKLLAAAGYEVLDTQVRLTWTFHCDGEPVEIELRCDAIVARDGRRLVAEVKTGDQAPALETAATRRQLLEYAIAYDADGVLLVVPEAGLVREVDFALRRGS
jgi:hypothetical protein